MENFESPPKTTISEPSKKKLEVIKKSSISVICGRNNSGKSYLLRQLVADIGSNAFYLGPARYNNFTHLSVFSPSNKKTKERKYRDLLNRIQNDKQNIDNSPLNLNQAIAELTDSKRDKLFELLERLLGSEINICHTIPSNEMSQKYIEVDGHNLSFTSSGFRLAATLLTVLLNDDYSVFLIDEPELGLSPEIQGIIADFIFNKSEREKNFSHIDSIVLATHSPIFIDRHRIKNNYFVMKEDEVLKIDRMNSVQDINSLQFFLLGNRFETLFLPAIILLVEGICDYKYINKIVTSRFPKSNISIIQCNGDSRMKEILNIANQMLQNISHSPYSNRIFAVLDSVHGFGLKQKLTQMGIKDDNIITWKRNGIEYLYPTEILETKFGKFDELNISDDIVSANGIEVKKGELVEYVINHYSSDVSLPEELNSKLLSKLDKLTY